MMKTVEINSSPQYTLLIVPPIFILIATGVLSSRFNSRRARKQPLLADDWLTLAALVLSYFQYVTIVLSVMYGGMGTTIFKLKQENLDFVFRSLTAIGILWATAVSVVQLSILALYIRTFKVIKWHRHVCVVAMCVVVGWWMGFLVATVTACIPFEAFWKPIPGKCIKLTEFCIGSGLVHVIIDLFILTFPLPIIWTLKTTVSRKITISIAFTLGIFATLVGLLRLDCLIPILHYDESNFTLSAWIGVLFQILENATGIICSCLPMLAKFVGKLAETKVATIIRLLLTRSSQSGSRRSIQIPDETPNVTIGRWRTRPIKKTTTLAVTTNDRDSLGHFAHDRPVVFEGQDGYGNQIEMKAIGHNDNRGFSHE